MFDIIKNMFYNEIQVNITNLIPNNCGGREELQNEPSSNKRYQHRNRA